MNTERMLNNFFEQVRIPSESPNDQEFISYFSEFSKKEGWNPVKDAYGNLIVKVPALNSTSKEYLGLGVHADTVKPGIGIDPYRDGDHIKSKGETILAADCKAGLAEIVEAIKSAKKRPPIEIIVTRCEEIGCLGAKNMDFSLVQSKKAYILDGEEPEFAFIGGPTYYTFDVEYIGKPAHAGMEPEKGISAIQCASYAISKMKLGRLDEESTANVGTINGGLIRNGIPEKCSLLAETRSLNHEKCKKNAEIMVNIFKEAAECYGAKVNVKETLNLKAYKIGTDSQIFKVANGAFTKLGFDFKGIVITGGTDATPFNSNGIETIVLGNGSRKVHSCDEYAIVSEMEVITKALIDIMDKFA